LKQLIFKALKFGIVGVVATCLNYGSFALLCKLLGVYYLASSALGYILGLIIGYYLNKYWTFINQINKIKNYFWGYIIVYVISLIASQLLLLIQVETLNMNPMYSNIFAIILSSIMNFIGINYFVFIKPKNAPVEDMNL